VDATGRTIPITPMSADSFAPFGDLLECAGPPDKLINQGLCERFHDRAQLDFGDGRAGISLFQAQLRTLPYTLNMVERHPDGSQAFFPMSAHGFLVIVAQDAGGVPVRPQAFLTQPGQGINFHRNIWHGVLTPLQGSGQFVVVDRIGGGANLQEHWFETPYIVE
jgi:ureidoglycolate lyase